MAAESEVPTTGTTDAEVQSGPPLPIGIVDAGEQLEEMRADSVDTGVQPEESSPTAAREETQAEQYNEMPTNAVTTTLPGNSQCIRKRDQFNSTFDGHNC